MKTLLILFALTTALFLSSCGTMPGMSVLMAKKEAAKLRPSYKKFQNLCKSEKRSKIYKSVSAKGYLYARTSSASCGDWHPDLRRSEYKFIECSENNINDYTMLNNGRLVRFSIVDKENTSCMYSKEDKTITLEEYKDSCLVKEAVNSPKSDYAYLYENGYVNEKSEHVLKFPNDRKKKDLISYEGFHILSLNNYETLAVNRDYTYWPEGISMQIKYTCEDKSRKSIFSVEDILIP